MKKKKLKLPRALRKYIRGKKSKIRRQYGSNSIQEKEFLEWIKKTRERKMSKLTRR